jgi:RHS repeat-associated protein
MIARKLALSPRARDLQNQLICCDSCTCRWARVRSNKMSGSLNAQISLKRFQRARSQRAFKRPRTRTKFGYDALGRRVRTTVNSVTTPYLYDGQNPAMISSNQLLADSGLDEIYALINSAGTTSYLRDGLNSAVADTNSSAATTANYFYSPYGDSASTGIPSTPQQYTGRENDGATGLYYYRARYYSPQLGRFISEDPVGLAGGANYYAYVGGDPIGRLDPLGLATQIILGGGVTAIAPFFGGGLNFNFGLNIDGWNSSIFIQDQANIGVGFGAFFGLGLNLQIAHGDAPTTGFAGQKYLEADVAWGPGLGASLTGNNCGGLDWSGAKGIKPGVGKGAGVFIGNTYTATAVSPTIYTVLNAILESTVKTTF